MGHKQILLLDHRITFIDYIYTYNSGTDHLIFTILCLLDSYWPKEGHFEGKSLKIQKIKKIGFLLQFYIYIRELSKTNWTGTGT